MAKAKSKFTRNDDPARFVKSEYDPVDRLEREPGGRLYEESPAAPPPPPGEEPNRILRRWSAKYEWDAIYGEIAHRCIDPKTRQVKVPKNESMLAEAVLQWC